MTQLSAFIDEAWDRKQEESARQYIGASIIGNSCQAYLSLSMRGFPNDPPPARLKRIFRDGHRIEEQVVSDLKRAGIEVMEVDPNTGRQWQVKLYGGHVAMHADGKITLDGESLLLEIKSMNQSKFTALKNKGVKVSHPIYFDQVQFMLGHFGMLRGKLVAYCKNTSEYHDEEIEFDPFRFSYLCLRAEQVLQGESRRISSTPAFWECKSCFKRTACWNPGTPEKNCGTCRHSSPFIKDTNGAMKLWHCARHDLIGNVACHDWDEWRPT